MNQDFSEAIDELERNDKPYQFFCNRVVSLISENPELEENGMPCVHSVRHRKKSKRSIIDKCERKFISGTRVTAQNVSDEIEDYMGVRLLHLHFDQIPKIHAFLNDKVAQGEFIFNEKPKSYTWDPEYNETLDKLGFEVQIKESLYTSVHYIIRSSPESPIRCELQVRTLFEETWGELDHWMNYPKRTENLALREQLLVLSRVVTAGSRLAVSINRIYNSGDGAKP